MEKDEKIKNVQFAVGFFAAVLLISILGGVFFLLSLPYQEETSLEHIETALSADANATTPTASPVYPVQEERLANPPEIIRAVYLTGMSAGSTRKIQYILDLAKHTTMNAVVIDIKDFSGLISYPAHIPDVNALVKKLHESNLYVIGRITVFQDPVLAKARPDITIHSKAGQDALWLDNKGLAWMDPASSETWDYNIAIAKDAARRGFDEINFDYVRFPSDGDLEDMIFPVYDESVAKSEVIKEFFAYLSSALADTKISVDLFGLSTVKLDDLGIGQKIEDAYGNFDYVSPMVYPSHYADGFLGFKKPAEKPYEVVEYSLLHALLRLTKFEQNATEQGIQYRPTRIRPWLQDFTIRGVEYDEAKVHAQIKATKDALGESFAGYMLWNPQNIYTKSAID
ncbi:MAG: GTP-binding protein [Candidatus Wildermuthbacteria bacterium]|nr:GTP-binding protein [Candidatus Wildermuthbacteria bacterium]